MKIPDDLVCCERGNTLLVQDDNFVAWFYLGEKKLLEVSWYPDNYPALHIAMVGYSEEELAKHIQEKFAGWFVRKLNTKGVVLDGEHIADLSPVELSPE